MMERILVVGPSWVGDMVMAQTLIGSLKTSRPRSLIDVMAPRSSVAVASRMPEVNEAILFDVGHGELRWSYRREFARQHGNYSQAIVLPNSIKSALVPALAGIDRRTGFLGEMRYFLLNDIRFLDKRKLPRMVDRFMALGDPPMASKPLNPELGIDADNQQQLLQTLNLTTGAGPVLGLCPGAEFGDAKRWPEQQFASAAKKAISQGMQVWIFGSPGDMQVANNIENMVDDARQCHNLAGKTTILDAIDLLALCQLVISNDSGLMHIAAAVNCQVSVLYGSSSPEFTPPLSDRNTIHSLNLPCSPCFKRVCPLGHKDCLNNLQAERLFPDIQKIIDQ